ncbi:hypothetical protein BDQ12DRAFT_729239 [Crucibulum laeve]|uniref:DUF6533 domain-containing protein n=1 Tax=Crucibulum laeve TaxID=68775 RepID=A0A5C3LG90_9AGAR|nr:hypothetical protein BDQ12DRAFT_729239 [Crucibulum laeve]
MTTYQASAYDSATSPNGEIAQALYMPEWSSLGAVAIILWDTLLLLDDEYIHIWRTPSFALKWVYVFAPYFALLFQLTNYYFLTHTLSRPPISESICSLWTVVQAAGTQLMMIVIEGVLMLRCLFSQSQNAATGRLLVAVFLMQRVIAAAVSLGARKHVQFDEMCRAKNETTDVFIFGAGVLVTQVVIWTMTLKKRKVRMESGSNSRFVSLLIRDGA